MHRWVTILKCILNRMGGRRLDWPVTRWGEVGLETENIIWIEYGAWICWLAEALLASQEERCTAYLIKARAMSLWQRRRRSSPRPRLAVMDNEPPTIPAQHPRRSKITGPEKSHGSNRVKLVDITFPVHENAIYSIGAAFKHSIVR